VPEIDRVRRVAEEEVRLARAGERGGRPLHRDRVGELGSGARRGGRLGFVPDVAAGRGRGGGGRLGGLTPDVSATPLGRRGRSGAGFQLLLRRHLQVGGVVPG